MRPSPRRASLTSARSTKARPKHLQICAKEVIMITRTAHSKALIVRGTGYNDNLAHDDADLVVHELELVHQLLPVPPVLHLARQPRL